MSKTYERVQFTMICTPCCHTLLCYVNPRMPNYCSECGARLYALKLNPEAILFRDDNAGLRYTVKEETIMTSIAQTVGGHR